MITEDRSRKLLERVLVLCLIGVIFSLHAAGGAAVDTGVLGTDTGNNLSFLLGRDRPELFVSDPMLKDLSSSDFYPKLVQWIMRGAPALAGLGATDPSLLDPSNGAGPRLAGVLLVPFWLLGMYALARHFGARVSTAAVIMVLSAGRIGAPLGGDLGLLEPFEFAPRHLFQTALPYLVILIDKTREEPKRWPLVAALLSAMIYVHPVSAPAFGACIFAAWVVCGASASETGWRRFTHLALAAVAALLVMIPFTQSFALQGGGDLARTEYATLYETGLARFKPGFYHFGVAALLFAVAFVGQLATALTLGAFALFGLRATYASDKARPQLKFWTVACGAFFILSFGLPLVEHATCKALGRLPFEVDVIRGLRFWPFWLLVFGLLGSPYLKDLPRRFRYAPHALALGLAFLPRGLLHGSVALEGALTLVGEPSEVALAAQVERRTLEDFLVVARGRIPPGEVVAGPHFLRHALPRAVAYAFKDGGNLYYAAQWERLLKWRALSQRWAAESPNLTISVPSKLTSIEVFGIGSHLRRWVELRRQLEPGALTGLESKPLLDALGASFLVVENADVETLRQAGRAPEFCSSSTVTGGPPRYCLLAYEPPAQTGVGDTAY